MRRMINSSVYDGPLTTPQDMFEERLNKRFDELNEKLDKAVVLLHYLIEVIDPEQEEEDLP